MPTTDAVQLVHATLERNREIPAVLDAFGEFIDSPIGPLELQHLDEVFERILDNLVQRFPEAASKRAASTVHSEITSFLIAAGNNVDRLKEILKSELKSFGSVMVPSIAERFRRMTAEERKAVDAALRVIRRSRTELLFKVNAGKQLTAGDTEFQKHFAIVKSQSKGIRELRYENLVVEKGIFNKLILKSKAQDYFIWVPSFYAVDNADSLIEKDGVSPGHLLLSRLKDLDSQGRLDSLKSFLEELEENQGVISKEREVPQEISDFLHEIGEYKILPPIDLDEVTQYFQEKDTRQKAAKLEELEKQRLESEALRSEQERKSQLLREKMRATTIQVATEKPQEGHGKSNSLFLGKRLDFGQFASAINRRIPEGEFAAQIKQLEEFGLEFDKLRDIAIVGSSGSGKSVTMKRLLDGLAIRSEGPKIIVIDPKGEHRGIAWKYKWKVLAFVTDSQASELRVSLSSGPSEDVQFTAYLIQDWFAQGGFGCTDQQKERIAAIISEQTHLDFGMISDLLTKDTELSLLGQRLKKSLVFKSSFPRIFSGTGTTMKLPIQGSTLFDLSGRGLKDPTTREERQLISVLLLRDLAMTGLKNSVIVLEDTLDRFKIESLKSRTLQIIKKLHEDGNRFLVTSRSRTREFLEANCIELVHRLSGEKVINDELSEFKTDVSKDLLTRMIGFMPRGYLITSQLGSDQESKKTSAVKVEPMQFIAASV